ncbi:HAD family hydrolase [Virgibacillus oceani]
MAKCIINEQAYDIDGILFDKDGTLIEFSSLWVTWAEKFILSIMSKAKLPEKDQHRLADAIGFQFDQGKWDPKGPLCIGSLDELITIGALHLYQNGFAWNESLEIVTNAQMKVDQLKEWKKTINPVSGLRTFLQKADSHYLKLGVVTSDNQQQALSHLQELEIDSYFNSVIGHDQVMQGKPFPDMVYKACKDMMIEPERAIIIGDSNGDMILGMKSNTVASIGIAAESSSETDHLTNADHVIHNYDSITFEEK